MKRDGVARTMKAGQFKARCLKVMDEVEASGTPVIITKRGRPVAQLGPVLERPRTLVGFLRGRLRIKGNIVSPADVEWDVLRR